MMINNTVPTTGTTTATSTSSDDMVINDTVDGGDVGVVVADVDHNNIISNNNNTNQTVTSISPLPTQPKLSSSLSSQHLLLSSQQQQQITTNANATTIAAANSQNVIDQQQQNQPSLSSLSSSSIITSASCRLSSKKKTNNKKQKNNIISNLNLNNFNNNSNNNLNNINNKTKRNSFLSLSSYNNSNCNVENSNETTMITNENQQQIQPKSSSPLNENNINDSFSVVSSSAINEMIIHHHHNSNNSNNNNNNNNNNNSINDHHHIHNPHPHHHQHHSHNNNNNNNEMIAQVTNDPILSAYPNMDLSETQGITKRTVIIHKDSRGYGMRISGDNPVFIQHVNEEGAAYRAGVRSGDRIIKVNGTLVTKLGHTEVVNMIKNCGSFVGLTLLSKAPSTAALASTANISSSSIDNQSRNLPPISPTNSPTPPSQQSSIIQSLVPNLSPSHAEAAFSPIYPMEGVLLANNSSKIITGPQPVPVSTQQHFQENSIRTLKEMLKDELRHLEELKLMCAPKVELERCQKRISEIKMKLDLHQTNISSSFVNVVHSRQQSLDNDFRNCSSQHQTSIQANSNTGSGMTSPRIIPMDDDVDIDPDGTYQQQYEYIDDLELYDRDTAGTSKPITKSVSNPTPILRSNQGNDTTKNNNNRDKTKRDSKILSSIMEQQLFSISPQGPQWWINLNQESLRICRYLIQQMIAPKELLFYVMTKMVFPQIVTTSINNKSQVIKRWAYQIIATFIIKESPLFMREFPTDYLEKFDRNLNALISANPSTTDVVASPFDPFLSLIFDVVRKQWDEFMTATHRQRLPPTSNPKHDLQSCIEMLLTTHLHICSLHLSTIGGTVAGGNNIQAKLDLRDIDSILDSFIQHVKLNKLEPTMALISSLLAIGRYIFKLNPSKHCLLLETSGAVPSLSSTSNVFPLATIVASNPLSKLSSETSNNKKSGQKRTSMIPIGSKSFSSGSHVLGNSFDSTSSTLSLSNNSKSSSQISGVIIEDHSHCFVPIIEMDHIIYCASFNCMLPMWGDPYTLKCTKCLMHTHLWCRKHAAANNTCNNDTQHQHQNSQSSQSGKQSNRRVKSEKKSVFEKITGKRTSKRTDFSSGSAANRSSSSDSNSTSDSSSSLEFSSDCEEPNIPPTSTINMMPKHEEEIKSSDKTLATVTVVNQNPDVPVNRSGSFVQRKKKKSTTSVGSPRKRSDPALTSKQISTMSGNSSNTGTGTIPQLTSARSSGALMNSASVGAHDSQFRPITGQRAKHLTSSDSSLISATSAASKMKSTPSSSGVANIFANNDSNKSSSTNLTSTSSPRKTRHRNTNDSAIQMDGSSEDDLNDFGQCNEQSNEELNEKDISDVPPAPPPPPPFSNPPPLPPRPDSEKRRQIQMEILQTEEEHYEVLRYIRNVYQKPLKKEKLLTHEQMDIIFGNVKELKRIHRSIFRMLNTANKNQMLSMNPDLYHLEKVICDIFCGELGEKLAKEAGEFCVNRKIKNGIELWNSKKKDSRLKGLVDTESRTRLMPENPFARLGLDDLLSRVFQRPLRYPLLFERLLKSTPKDSQGYCDLEKALISCRKYGERINEATKKAELKARLSEIIRKTDFSSFSNQSLIENLEKHELLHEGPLIWRITKTKLVEVLLILTDSIILVLTRDSSDRNRYSLKSHSNPNQNNKLKLGHRPDIKMDDLLMRDVATDHAAFFLVSKSQDIIYEFAATTSSERNKWKDVITKAIEEYHKTNQLLQTQKSFTSTRSLTMTDLKTQISSSDDVAPPLPPPSILNRPLPKPPSESSPPPPPIPPPSSSFINRPLPKPPIDAESPSPSSSHHQPKYDGSIKFVSPQDLRPSTVEMVPFSQIQISPNSRVSLQQDSTISKSNDLKEINDNIKNSIQECQRSGRTNLEDLEREIQEMSMVYDVAKHDADSKETLSRLITDMFRKATEWSYHLVQDNEPAKQELSQRVRNSVESFVKSHIDLNFILPLPNDVNQEDECPDALFTNANRDIDDVDGIQESLITPMNSCQLNSSNPIQYSRVRRSLSDKSNKSAKSQEPGLNSNHIDQNTSNTSENYDIVDGDLNSESGEFVQNCQQLLSKPSPSPNPFDLKSSKFISSMASVPQTSILSNPFLDHNTNDNEIMTTFNTNLEISSIGVEEFVSTPENEDSNFLNENNDGTERNIDHINNQEQQFSDDRTNENFDVNNDQSLDQTLQTTTSSNQTHDVADNNQSAIESSTLPTTSLGSSTTKTSQTYMI